MDANEYVRDIVKEARARIRRTDEIPAAVVSDWMDRIEAAANRGRKISNDLADDNAEMLKENENLKAEIEKLRKGDNEDPTSITIIASHASGKWNVVGVAKEDVTNFPEFGELLNIVGDYLRKSLDDIKVVDDDNLQK